MKFQGIELRVPRHLVEQFEDIFSLNGYTYMRADEESQPEDGPIMMLLHVGDFQLHPIGEMCDACGEWDGEHTKDCTGACPDCGEPHGPDEVEGDPLDTDPKPKPPKAN